MQGTGYRLPEPSLAAIADAAPLARLAPAPREQLALVLHARAMPSIAELARPEIRMAGLRWNPRLAAAVGGERVHEVQLIELTDGRVHRIDGLPNPLSLADWSWSPDGQQLAFSHHDDAASEVQLWCVEVQSRRARRLVLPALHAVMGAGFVWASDSQRLLLTLRPEAPWPEPEASASPGGPVVEEASPLDRGRQTRTFADLLRSEHDERLLEHHLLSQLAWVDLEGGLTRLGEPALHQAVDPSPDGLQLLVQRLERPFSHRVPAHRFARCIEVLDASGALLHTVARLDAADRLPSGFDAVPPGPREVHWRADADACLAWVEAADGGDPDQVAQVRDQLWLHAAPFSAPPRCIAQLPLRFGQVAWADGGLAVVTERWWRTRAIAYWRIAPDKEGQTPRRFHSGSLEDRYADPGQAVMRADARGRRRLLAVDGDVTTWTGTGASPQGDRPFVDRWNLSTDQKVRVFQSDLSHHDVPVAPLDDAGSTWLSTRETPDLPPQYRVVVLHSLELARDVTHWPHPTPQLRGLHRQTLHYRRADGVTLNGTLWLPPGHDPHRDGPLPTLVWAYPMEFISTAAAGQVDGSPLRFNTFDPLGPAVMVVAGYAVLDNPSMPIIGSADSPANDSFVPQLVANAQAAVDELVRLGVAEPHRIAIGGHSFGAFMAANLLAHSRLFCAGIARSGAYNRTLTPFGFQSEERHFWQAREMYRAVSPFDEADKIHAPLLLIHGLADANSGTFPMQSERMFAALRGLGSTARLVLLPHEGHRYVARESILHVLAETLSWLDQHVSAALPQNGERLGVVSTANSSDR